MLDDAELLHGKEPRLKRERVGLDVFRLTAGWRRPLLAATAQRGNQMFGRSVIEAGRQGGSAPCRLSTCSHESPLGVWGRSPPAGVARTFAHRRGPLAACNGPR